MTPKRNWPEPKEWPRSVGVAYLDENGNMLPPPAPQRGGTHADRARAKAARQARKKNRRKG